MASPATIPYHGSVYLNYLLLGNPLPMKGKADALLRGLWSSARERVLTDGEHSLEVLEGLAEDTTDGASQIPVVVVENGEFDAAAVIYNPQQMEKVMFAIRLGDSRPFRVVLIDRKPLASLLEGSGHPETLVAALLA